MDPDAPELLRSASMSGLRTGEIKVHDTHIGVWEETVDVGAMRRVYRGVLNHLRRRGFALALDNTIGRSIRWDYRNGKTRNGLEVRAETGGRTITVEFFQNVANVENPNGGRYDFDKFRKMPRDLRLRCAVEMSAVIRYLQGVGYTLDSRMEGPLLLGSCAHGAAARHRPYPGARGQRGAIPQPRPAHRVGQASGGERGSVMRILGNTQEKVDGAMRERAILFGVAISAVAIFAVLGAPAFTAVWVLGTRAG